MTEVATILGGEDNIEKAILSLVEKNKPEMIGLLTTGLTETRGEDMIGILKSIRKRNPELDYLPIIYVSTPDYIGAMQDGYAAAVEAIVSTEYGVFVEPDPLPDNVAAIRTRPQVTVLAGSALSPGDVDEIKELIAAFGLNPLVLPDLSLSLDGHLDDDYNAVTPGGTTLDQLKQLERSHYTIALGESMRGAAEILQQRFGTDYEVFSRVSGLAAVDSLLWTLARVVDSVCDPHFLATPQIPAKYSHQRRQLQDAMLDTHFYIGGKKIALALEPDLLYQTSWLLKDLGAEITAAVTTTKSPLLNQLPIANVTIGDLEDLEDLAEGVDLIITNSHGKRLAQKLNSPLYRLGYPIVDRLGNGSRCLVGYRGTMQFLFEIGNIFLEQDEAKAHH